MSARGALLRSAAGARLPGAAIVFLLLAACGDSSPPPEPGQPASAAFARDTAGTWATTPRLCGRAVWRISPAAVVSDSGVACSLGEFRPAANGWTVPARCVDRPSGSLEFAPTAGAPSTLVISGAPFNTPVTLVQCAAPGGEQPSRDPHAPLDAATAIDLAIATDETVIEVRRDQANAVVRAAWWKDGELIKLVEPSVARDQGPRRIYYYAPGEETPFLVREQQATFAFAEGNLVNIFSPEGEVLGPLERARFDTEIRAALRDSGVARKLARTLAPPPPGSSEASAQTAGSGPGAPSR